MLRTNTHAGWEAARRRHRGLSCWASRRCTRRRASSSWLCPGCCPLRARAAAAGARASQSAPAPGWTVRSRPQARAPTVSPRMIALVTSRDGAAVHDIVTVTRKRWPGVRLLVLGARVQGEGAVEELVRALRLVNRLPGLISASWAAAVAPGRTWRPSTARRCAARWATCGSHHLRGGPRDRHFPHRPGRRCASGHSLRGGGAGGRRPSRRAATGGRSPARLAAGLTARTRLASARLARTADRLQAAVEWDSSGGGTWRTGSRPSWMR